MDLDPLPPMGINRSSIFPSRFKLASALACGDHLHLIALAVFSLLSCFGALA
jgi:hypothetical protein